MPSKSFEEEDDDEAEGPTSSFETYLAEGDALFNKSEYKKALESYRLALELQPNDKICLVARSKCYLKLGDLQKALQDADGALEEDKTFNRGLYRKAEALYCMGDFEYSLMYYHRGHKLRPELDEFRLGIQKAQEAIDNSIGIAANIKLENKGDLSFFTKQNDKTVKKRTGGMAANPNARKLQALASKKKEVKTSPSSKKTVKQLLEELYADKEYFEKLMKDEAFIKQPRNSHIFDLVQSGINYLETRTDFWRQQRPLYARKRNRAKINLVKKKKTKPIASSHILDKLKAVEEAMVMGKPDRSLQLAEKLLKCVEGIKEKDLPNKLELVENINLSIKTASFEIEKIGKTPIEEGQNIGQNETDQKSLLA